MLHTLDDLVHGLVATRLQVKALSSIIDSTDRCEFTSAHASQRDSNLRADPLRMLALSEAVVAVNRFQGHINTLHRLHAEMHVNALPCAFSAAAGKGELKVQIGASPEHAAPGWVSVGFETGHSSEVSPVIQASITAASVTIPLPTGSCAFIYASHFLEHLPYPNVVDAVLCEMRRLLRAEGIVRIVVPDAEAWLTAHVATSYSSNCSAPFRGPLWDGVRCFWPWWDLTPSDPFARAELGVVASYLGCGGVTAALEGNHQMAFDFALLHATLLSAHFTNISRSELHGSYHEALRGMDHTSSVAEAEYIGPDSEPRSLSLFVEAMRP